MAMALSTKGAGPTRSHLHIAALRGSMVVPDMFDSYLPIGDETALPAIARRLEELPANRRATR